MYEPTSRSAICIVDAKSPPSSSSLVLGMSTSSTAVGRE
jgi:hypothetical protein